MQEWISVKNRLPPFHIFVEVIYGSKTRMNDLYRGFCCLCQGNEEDGIFWSKDGSDERDWGKFGITHWKQMTPDHLGRIPVVYANKKRYFKVKMKKIIKT